MWSTIHKIGSNREILQVQWCWCQTRSTNENTLFGMSNYLNLRNTFFWDSFLYWILHMHRQTSIHFCNSYQPSSTLKKCSVTGNVLYSLSVSPWKMTFACFDQNMAVLLCQCSIIELIYYVKYICFVQIIHGNQSCGSHFFSFLLQAYKRAVPVYLPVYLIPALIVHRQGLLKR